MKFAEVVGHSGIKSKFNELIAAKRLPHAMMLLGNEGSGGLAMALAIAQNVVCEKRNNNTSNDGGMFGESLPKVELTDACGVCAACGQAEKLIHPDIYFTFPVFPKKRKKDDDDEMNINDFDDKQPKKSTSVALSSYFIDEWRKAVLNNPYQNYIEWLQSIEAENKQGNISVHECHEIVRTVKMRPYSAPYKIRIIWLAEYLKETGNALLKVIEEPPADTLFIFVVEQAEQMLGTILSRTQITKLPPIADEDLARFLAQNYSLENAQANRIAKISEGNLNRAMLYALGGTNEYETSLQEWLSASVRLMGNYASEASVKMQELSDKFAQLGRENQKAFIQYGLWFLREVLQLNQGLTSEKLDAKEQEYAARMNRMLNPDKIYQLQKTLSNFHYHIERNANPKISFYAVSFQFYRIFTSK